MYPPDNMDRSRASANCVGSYLHSTWWLAQTNMTHAMPGQFYGPLNGLGGLMGSVGNSQLNPLQGIPLNSKPWWQFWP